MPNSKHNQAARKSQDQQSWLPIGPNNNTNIKLYNMQNTQKIWMCAQLCATSIILKMTKSTIVIM